MNVHERQELETVLRRFAELSTRAQLRAYEVIREYLGDGIKATKGDHELAERAAALEALRQVADELRLPEGRSPTTTQFDEVSKRLGLDWTVSRVIRAWGRWRFATDAFTGHRARPSAHQRALQSASTGTRRTHEDYLTALRLWLDTKPAATTTAIYDAWAREYNEERDPGERPVPGWIAIYRVLGVSFENALRAARGEIELAEAPKALRMRQDHGPLVSTRGIANAQDLLEHQARHVSNRRDFPRPVIKLSGHRAWLRDDVEAYFAGREFPERQDYELQADYLSAAEVAPLVGCSVPVLSMQRGRVPKAAGRVSSRQYWRRGDIERWLEEREIGGQQAVQRLTDD
jgi:predicted DNA-binding transcriptional regulator AlpA